MSGPIPPPLTVSDEDDGGSVSGTAISTIEVTDGTLTVSGTKASVTTGGGGGSGTVTSIGLTSDSGSTSTITSSGTFTIAGGTNVTTSATGTTVTINSTDQYVGTVTSVTGSSPVSSTEGTTPDISMAVADTGTDGYLSSTDWDTFNDKQTALTLTTLGTSGASTLVTGTLNIPQYSGGGGGGDVTVTGTPVAQQVPIWDSASSIEGSANLTFDGNDLTVSNIIKVGDGSAGTPAYNFDSNAQNGMYKSAGNEISFSAGATQMLAISSSRCSVKSEISTIGATDLVLTTNGGTDSATITMTDGVDGDIGIVPDGTGNVNLGNLIFDADQTVGVGTDNYVLTYDDTAKVISLEASGGGGASSIGELSDATTEETDNVGLGSGALDAMTTGATLNIALGVDAATSLTTSNKVVALGYKAAQGLTSGGSESVAVGHEAMYEATTGSSLNVAIGSRAGYSISTGERNVLIGRYTGYSHTVGDNCVAVGSGAAAGTGGSGSGAGSGDYNISLGASTGGNITSGAGLVLIGGDVDATAADTDRELRIEGYNGTNRTKWIKGDSSGVITFNDAYAFPAADGDADQVLTTDGAGTLTFEDAGGGSTTTSWTQLGSRYTPSSTALEHYAHNSFPFGTYPTTTDSRAADTVFFTPYVSRRSAEITHMQINIDTLSTDPTAIEIGIYEVDATTNLPYQLLGFGSASITSTGWQTISIGAVAGQSLELTSGGLYWLAGVFDEVITIGTSNRTYGSAAVSYYPYTTSPPGMIYQNAATLPPTATPAGHIAASSAQIGVTYDSY